MVTRRIEAKVGGIGTPPAAGSRLPALFVGHGSPTNAIESTAFSREWAVVAGTLPRPKAILCISAHWETTGARVTAAAMPPTIHDFRGFPPALGNFQYPAPGSPTLANRVQSLLAAEQVAPDPDRGLDHGAWAVLCRMYPQVDIPVVQLSLDRARSPRQHYDLACKLAPLRDEGVLILGSGNVVHNLGLVEWTDRAFAWALAFDARVKQMIEQRRHADLIDFAQLGKDAELAIPTPEHFLPLLYALAQQGEGEPATFFCEKVTLGSMSMRGVRIG